MSNYDASQMPHSPSPSFATATPGGPAWQSPGYATVSVRHEPAAGLALALSVTSFVIWFLPAIVAFAMASAAKRNIAASNGLRKGKGVALAAQIISVVGLVFAGLGVAVITFI